ncbi:MAG: MupA/Atu3671 family FMN-dependent luciferase-like monooxygenase [Anaerolineae bacterium]
MKVNGTMSCVMMGSESLLIQCAELWIQQGNRLVAIITSAKPILEWAQQTNIPIISPNKQLAKEAQAFEFDYLFSIANLLIVPTNLLKQAKVAAYNFHDGLLPGYAGLYTPTWAIINQEKQHGVTWHQLEATIDTGDIAVQDRFELAADETSMSLNVKCFEAGIKTFSQLHQHLSSQTLNLQPQNLNQQIYYAKYQRPSAAGTLDWNQPAENIDSLIRALNFGTYDNPLALPKIYLKDQFVFVTNTILTQTQSQAPVGSIVTANQDGLTVSTISTNIRFEEFLTIDGRSLNALDLLNEFEFQIGDTLPQLTTDQKAEITQLHQRIVRSEAIWRKRLANLVEIEIPYAKKQINSAVESEASLQNLSETTGVDHLTALIAAYLLRLSNQQKGTVLLQTPQSSTAWPTLFSEQTPLPILQKATVDETLQAIAKKIQRSHQAESYSHDLLWRDPVLKHLNVTGSKLPLSIAIEQGQSHWERENQTQLLFQIGAEGKSVNWVYDKNVFTAESILQMQKQFAAFIEVVNQPQNQTLSFDSVSLLTQSEQEELLYTWNDTWQDIPADQCIHHQFMAQAAKTPDATAVIYLEEEMTYRELDERSNQFAHHLIDLGVAPDVPVGLFLDRTFDMFVALYGIHKAGGAYLPLDPEYPADRLAFMVADTATPVLITQNHLVSKLPEHNAAVVRIDADWQEQISRLPITPPETAVTSANLSYLIYTSGSTGTPKGVMIEHRNVINFFVGMDERIPHEAGQKWLAVTSLSFDISVLEVFWTLCRGLTVVLYNCDQEGTPNAKLSSNNAIDFSLYYFASDEAEQGLTNKYELLLEGAKFADENNFSAVWTPERHFHAFGGLYPNPSVISAALATMTENIQIRAGSVVLPLHHPARVAEEWAVVDNLSNGRVGISFAAGWQPNDFIFQPDNFADRKNIMFEQIEEVRRLWRGETITYEGGNGPVETQTLPRPIQPELPTWVTAAGNPDTFRQAGANGHNLLTHLLGQTVEELGEKIDIYRRAWCENNHPGTGHVTILLHTFIGPDLEKVKEMVRKPMTDYLRSSVFLIRQAAWSFPTFKQKASETGQTPQEVFDNQELSESEMEALLDHSFERYFEHSSLLGDFKKGIKTVNELKRIGINEIACQVDFGVPTADTLAHLPHLNRLRQLMTLIKEENEKDYSIPALMERHGVTHFQCTPSMMGMLIVERRQKAALRHLKVCMLGGEALPQALAGEMLTHLQKTGKLINMYGPTETTIWSATQDVVSNEQSIPVGRPITNTALYIVDEQLNPVPPGLPGELLIGGDGVVRGYFKRPELTAERFVPDRFRREQGHPEARMYRTGDLARFQQDGTVDFLGRLDFQVKLRGFRIELGEIEALLAKHDSVREAVVTVREDIPGDKRMVAYLIQQSGYKINPADLRQHLKETLPTFMIPAHFIKMVEFPLTPNRKTDRKALPAPNAQLNEAEPAADFEPPTNDYQKQIAEIWQSALGISRISIHDNFFELGGHSILAVQVHRQMREKLQIELTIADMFRYATIASVSNFIGNQDAPVLAAHQTALSRAAKRRKALGLDRTRRSR